MEELRTGLSVAAIAISLISIWISVRNWRESNRPIMAAYVATHAAGNVAAMFDLVVVNQGTRPAVNVRLCADVVALDKALTNGDRSPLAEHVKRCFDPKRFIPLIGPGASVKNSFGIVKGTSVDSTWHYGSVFPVTITYRDLEGRAFASRLDVLIQNSEAFADSSWERATS